MPSRGEESSVVWNDGYRDEDHLMWEKKKNKKENRVKKKKRDG